MGDVSVITGTADPELDGRLRRELRAFNAAATADVAQPVELTVQFRRGDELLGGVSGWSWCQAAGIELLWVSEQQRGAGTGRQLLEAFEAEARRRGCERVFVSSLTFQAPAFYERAGFREVFRYPGVPTTGRDDVHLMKELG